MVENANWLDVNVFVVGISGVLEKIGVVASTSEAAFEISLLGGSLVRLLVDPIGSDEQFMTEEIMVSKGQMIVLEVTPKLSYSTWYVVDVEAQ